MIPFRDDNQSRSFPVVTVVLIAINVLVFLYQLYLGPQGDQFILEAALVPAREVANFPASLPHFFYSMFMHGGWLHIGGNMLYLWIFGDNVEDTLGHFLYLFFYLGCGLAASAAQIAMDPASTIPTLGASGAIAGVLGAYLILFPRAHVQTLVFIFGFGRVSNLPALYLLGFWFVLQLLPGFLSIGGDSGGVAYFAHIGGFLVGGLIVLLYGQLRGIPTVLSGA